MKKLCPKCGVEKDVSEFRFRSGFYKNGKPKGRQSYCIPCTRTYIKTIIANNPMTPERSRASRLKCRYGMSQSDYMLMFVRQFGRCAICHSNRRDQHGRLHIDHDHATGKVRQLLCGHCNRLLGLADDSVERLIAATAYLQKHGKA